MGGSAQKVSVGIVEVVLNARSGQVFRGVVKEGRQRWLADNVLPDEVRGPAWSSITDGGQRKDALLYVLRDPARNNPIAVASFQRFIDQVPRAQYESEMSAGWNAVNPKSVSSTEINYKLRFVYAEVKGGGDVIGFHDAVAMWAKGPDPVVVLAARGAGGTPPPQDEGPIVIYAHKGKDVGQAILFPGLGQVIGGLGVGRIGLRRSQ